MKVGAALLSEVKNRPEGVGCDHIVAEDFKKRKSQLPDYKSQWES